MSPTVASLTKEGGDGGDSGGGGGGLSGGAIAGIAIGAVAGAAALAGCAWVLLRRRRADGASNGHRTVPSPDRGTDKLSSVQTFSTGNGAGANGEAEYRPAHMGSGGAAGAGGLISSSTVGSGGTLGSGGRGGHSGGGRSGTGISSSDGAPDSSRNLPELAQHIAACEERSLGVFSGAGGDQRSMLEVPLPPLLSVKSLPDSLKDWVVDLSEVTFMRRPDGSLAELGRGAR